MHYQPGTGVSGNVLSLKEAGKLNLQDVFAWVLVLVYKGNVDIQPL
jgi:hypothetical protein